MDYSFSEIVVSGSVHEIRLIDDAFGKICNGVTDLSMQVRTLAAKLLGSMKLVSPKFLNQTLDKKLMSNMRRKVSTVIVMFLFIVLDLKSIANSKNVILQSVKWS